MDFLLGNQAKSLGTHACQHPTVISSESFKNISVDKIVTKTG